MPKKRKYDNSYMSFGFTFITERDGIQKPQWFICGKILANGSMKPTTSSKNILLRCILNMYQAQIEKADTSKPGFVPPLLYLPIG